LLARLLEGQLRPVFFGVLKMPIIARQKHWNAVVIIGHVAAIRIAKAFNLGTIRRDKPARGMQACGLKMARHLIFRADSIGQHFKLKRANHADNPL
jgi:hypothetical protein